MSSAACCAGRIQPVMQDGSSATAAAAALSPAIVRPRLPLPPLTWGIPAGKGIEVRFSMRSVTHTQLSNCSSRLQSPGGTISMCPSAICQPLLLPHLHTVLAAQQPVGLAITVHRHKWHDALQQQRM